MKNAADYSQYECPYAHLEKECGHELHGPEGFTDADGIAASSVWCACGYRGPVFYLDPEQLGLKKKGVITDNRKDFEAALLAANPRAYKWMLADDGVTYLDSTMQARWEGFQLARSTPSTSAEPAVAHTKAEADDPGLPKVTGSPKEIWLVYGDIEEDCKHEECGEVSWCSEPQYPADVRYVRADLATRTTPSQPAEPAKCEQNQVEFCGSKYTARAKCGTNPKQYDSPLCILCACHAAAEVKP